LTDLAYFMLINKWEVRPTDDAVHRVSLYAEMDTDRVHPRIGSGRVRSGRGSDLHFTAHFCALFSIVRILTVVI